MLLLLFKLLDGGYVPPERDEQDTHDGFWGKQWKKAKEREKQFARIEEIEEQIEEIEERLEAIDVTPVQPKSSTVVHKAAEPNNSERLRIIDMLIAHRERLIEQEDEELLLLL